MKLILFFLLIFNLGAFADVFSQTKISLNFKEADLSTVLSTIEHNSSYHFIYSNRKTPADKKVTVNADNEDVTTVLDKIFGELGFVYKELPNHLIAITTTENLSDKQAAAERITGLVTDEVTGETLIGATVKVKGTNIVAVVDASGKFSITAPSANSVLVINYVGYTELEVPLQGKTTIDIKLSKVTKNLEEVVVTGFGLSTKKATLAGAVSQLNAEDLSRSKATSVSGALIGKVPGISFRQNDGRPGSTPVIRVRDFGGDPLIVIDGVTRSMDSFNNLDFNDIESLNILKDGTSAIYGIGAENGVIVIVTKKGKRGQKPTISFDSYYGVQQIANFNKPADIKSYIRGVVQTETYGNGTVSVADASRSISRADYAHYMAGDPGYEGFNWYKYIYKDAPQSQVRLSVSGGTDNTDYFISGTNTSQGVGLRDFGNGFYRDNIQANVNTNISKRVKFGVSLNGYYSNESHTNVPGDDFNFAAETSYRNLPTKGPYANNNPLYPQNSSAGDWTYSYGLISPELSGTEATIKRNVQVIGTLEISIIEGLKARIQGSYAFNNQQFDSRRLSQTVYKYDAVNGYQIDQFNSARQIDRRYSNFENTSMQYQLEYKKSIGKHNFGATATMESRVSYSPNIRILGNQPADNIAYLPGYAYTATTEDNISLYFPTQGYIARVNYDYAGKYIIEGYGRYDGSPYYTPEKRWGLSPGGSIAYRISQEGFWKRSSILNKINDFKIRASYGVNTFNAQNPNDPYLYLDGYNFGNGNVIQAGQIVSYSAARGVPAPYVTWGKAYQTDIGIDMQLINSKLSVTLDYFNKTRAGILANKTDVFLPTLVGFTQGQENLNSDKTRGVDGSVNWRDRIGEVSYNIGASFTYGRSIVGFRYGQRFGSEYDRWRNPGNDVDRLQGGTFQLVAIGQFQNWDQISNYKIDQDGRGNTTIKPGDFMYKDTNGDGFINDLDRQVVAYTVNGGNPFSPPPLTFGFNFGVNYKGFSLTADFAGGTMYTFEQAGFMREWLPNQNTSQYIMDNSSYYSDPFDRTSPIIVGKYPLLLQTTPPPNTTIASTGWQTNVTYVKFRNLELGYTLPYSIVKPLGISNLKINLSAQNLYIFSNMPGKIDPEVTSNNGNAYPNPRILTAGVQVKF